MMIGFAKLIPAFTVLLQTGDDYNVGTSFSDSTLLLAHVVNGSLVSVPGYLPKQLNAPLFKGEDVIHIDDKHESATLDFRGAFLSPENDILYMTFTGWVNNSPQTAGFLQSDFANGTTTGYGHSFVQLGFETGDNKYNSAVTKKIFVGSEQLISNGPGLPLEVEIQVSEVSY
ncbi:hypothetical protein MMC25_004867 [Agyrium rufum]|nr:hypothetical protein [Agyrium rufum]